MKTLDLDEILHANAGYIGHDYYVDQVKKAMLEFGKQLLELAAENARLVRESGDDTYILKEDTICDDYVAHRIYVSKESILDTLKQKFWATLGSLNLNRKLGNLQLRSLRLLNITLNLITIYLSDYV